MFCVRLVTVVTESGRMYLKCVVGCMLPKTKEILQIRFYLFIAKHLCSLECIKKVAKEQEKQGKNGPKASLLNLTSFKIAWICKAVLRKGEHWGNSGSKTIIKPCVRKLKCWHP